MMKSIWNSLTLVTCACVLMVTATAAEKPNPDVTKTKTTSVRTIRAAWPAETLTGKIMMVDPAQKLVIVQGPEGVPFDVLVTPSTRIKSGDQKLALKDLTLDKQKSVSIRFIPERAGDIARTIHVTG